MADIEKVKHLEALLERALNVAEDIKSTAEKNACMPDDEIVKPGNVYVNIHTDKEYMLVRDGTIYFFVLIKSGTVVSRAEFNYLPKKSALFSAFSRQARYYDLVQD